VDSLSVDADRSRASIAELLCLVTGRAQPFGIKPAEDAEDFARAQAKQALGDVS
jgi:hypothetical protein